MHYPTTSQKKSSLHKASQGMVGITLSSNDFLFTQASICSSVMLEPNSYKIRPETNRFVNNNGETWSNESLRANYQTYIGGYNYIDHIQIPEKSVGFIADAVLRRRYLDEQEGLFIYYVDLLIATSRDHEDLCKKIALNDIKYLSMGCTAFTSRCSRCGAVVEEDSLGNPIYCEHLESQKGKTYFDEKGVQRRVAEILGSEEKLSCIFVEASWLTMPPAFGGAVLRNLLPVPKDHSISIQIPEEALKRPAIRMYLPTQQA